MQLAAAIVGFWLLSICLFLALWHVARTLSASIGERRRARGYADGLLQRLEEKRHRDQG